MDYKCVDCSEPITNPEEMYCEKCVQSLIDNEKKTCETLLSEIQELQDQLKRVKEEVSHVEDYRKKAEKVQEERNQLEKEVSILEVEEQKQTNELNNLKKQIMDQEKTEEQLWDQINKSTRKLYHLFENNQIADNQLAQFNSELDRLSKLDIVNDLFKISIQDEVGCINNLAIGKKADQAIDWDEVNAAVGHLALLLMFLMKKFKYPMQKIESIELNGSSTRLVTREYMQEKECHKTLNLYVRNQQKEEDEFNEAFLLLFMEFQQFCKYLADGDILSKRKIQLTLPYKMNGQMVGDKSINLKHVPNQKWGNWTDAVKKFLTNVKAMIVMNAQFDLSL